ncbi:2-amino-4-hydroxy-6-hydroxymethyldihydropteridine diphosphokinase [Isoptericola cucumis]|uniref:Bifunctional folate synthesis protein n=1 Tax=Isoptericola cucumis TaxID=1776856 RepID=A0ABQ2B1B5_9MICO|nr:2-amino-4-hydroxy-6-hydroxymethyldihydropteridine diphosphokinase [Isoptericola cucumis]GGI05489.1 hypothetical protein GCM10007368_06410 [Isoptericola cucumis]
MTFAAAVPGPQGQPLDQIRLDGVTATGHHGVLPHERTDGQEFRADVVMHLDTRSAASSDDLAATVSYADVAQDVHDVLAGSPADLVETVAERIAAAVLARPAVQAVDVRVHKPQAPIEVPFDDVSVVVRRDRSHAPVVEPVVEPVAEPVVEPVAEPFASSAEPAGAPAAVVAAEPVPVPVPAAPPVPAVDPLDAAPEQPVEAVLALGANLGDAQVTLREAVTDIDRVPGVQVTDVSPLARTAAVGGPEQPDFLNAVLIVRTTLAPRDLLRALQDVEDQHGRVRDERWGPRTLDVDIVQYGTLTSTEPDLELPHPRARERAFVLVPWAEVAPDAVLGGLGGGVVGQLAVTAPDRAGIRWLALDWLTGPTQSTGQVATGDAPAPSAPVPQADPAPAQVHEQAHEPQAPAQPQAPQPQAPHQPPPAQPQAPEAYAPEQQAPEAYVPQAYVPEQYAPEPEPYAPRPYAPSGETPLAQPGPGLAPAPAEPPYTPRAAEPPYTPPAEPGHPFPPVADAEPPFPPTHDALPQRSPAPHAPEHPDRPEPVFPPVSAGQAPPEPAPAGPIHDVPAPPAPVERPRQGDDGLVSGVPADLSPHAPVPPAPPEADVFPPYGGEPAQADPFPPFGAGDAGQVRDEERDEGRDR